MHAARKRLIIDAIFMFLLVGVAGCDVNLQAPTSSQAGTASPEASPNPVANSPLSIASPTEGYAAQTGVTVAGICENGLGVEIAGSGVAGSLSAACLGGSYSEAVAFSAGDGAKLVEVSQNRSAGKISQTRTFMRDTVAPVVTITSPITGAASRIGVAVQGSCETGLSVTIGGDVAALTVPCSNRAYSTGVIAFTGSDGAKTISVAQADLAGNISVAASRNFVKDTTPPLSLTLLGSYIFSNVPGGNVARGTCENNLPVRLTGSNLASSQILSFSCISGQFSASITPQDPAQPISALFSQEDAAGNLASVTLLAARDISPPRSVAGLRFIGVSPLAGGGPFPAVSSSLSEAPMIQWDDHDQYGDYDDSSGPHSGVKEFQYAVGEWPGGISKRNWTSVERRTSVSISGLVLENNMRYYISVRAVDNAGNVSYPSAFPAAPISALEWTVAASAPTPIPLESVTLSISPYAVRAVWGTSAISGIPYPAPSNSILWHQYSLGTEAGLTNLAPWTEAPMSYFISQVMNGYATPTAALTGLTLNVNGTYYLNVRTRNVVNTTSAPTSIPFTPRGKWGSFPTTQNLKQIIKLGSNIFAIGSSDTTVDLVKVNPDTAQIVGITSSVSNILTSTTLDTSAMIATNSHQLYLMGISAVNGYVYDSNDNGWRTVPGITSVDHGWDNFLKLGFGGMIATWTGANFGWVGGVIDFSSVNFDSVPMIDGFSHSCKGYSSASRIATIGSQIFNLARDGSGCLRSADSEREIASSISLTSEGHTPGVVGRNIVVLDESYLSLGTIGAIYSIDNDRWTLIDGASAPRRRNGRDELVQLTEYAVIPIGDTKALLWGRCNGCSAPARAAGILDVATGNWDTVVSDAVLDPLSLDANLGVLMGNGQTIMMLHDREIVFYTP